MAENGRIVIDPKQQGQHLRAVRQPDNLASCSYERQQESSGRVPAQSLPEFKEDALMMMVTAQASWLQLQQVLLTACGKYRCSELLQPKQYDI